MQRALVPQAEPAVKKLGELKAFSREAIRLADWILLKRETRSAAGLQKQLYSVCKKTTFFQRSGPLRYFSHSAQPFEGKFPAFTDGRFTQ